MSKPDEKRRAIEFRRQGLSYREIRQHVPVAKTTLSLWLRSVGLSKPQRQRLTVKRLLAARRGWEKLRRERLERAARAMAEAETEAQQWIHAGDLLWLVGTVLYWAEGSKPKPWRGGTKVQFTNMDLRTILLMREWLKRYCARDETDIGYELYIHEQASVGAATDYWVKHLGISRDRLRVRLKKHKPMSKRKNVGEFYYGTIRMTPRRSTMLNHRIAGWIQGLANHCGVG